MYRGYEMILIGRYPEDALTRLLTDDGLIVGISYAPLLHDEKSA
jgi:hypothetical protein